MLCQPAHKPMPQFGSVGSTCALLSSGVLSKLTGLLLRLAWMTKGLCLCNWSQSTSSTLAMHLCKGLHVCVLDFLCLPWQGKTVVAITSGANMNFERLRLVSELADLGASTEVMMATTIPERAGAFKEFVEAATGGSGSLSVTEFKYRCVGPCADRLLLAGWQSGGQAGALCAAGCDSEPLLSLGMMYPCCCSRGD